MYYGVNVTNTSATRCLTGGFFGVSAYSPGGHLLASSDTQQRGLGPGAATPTLMVQPGASVHFTVGFADNVASAGGVSCGTVVGSLHLIPPNDTSSDQVATPMQRGGWPALCEGLVLVGPIQPGASSY
ncbi:MAG: DUF4232 domain-containing protein [Actinomycetota bacterium]|nr:DUF4232 domain-containing protein [Actinomycetota bacterium]